MNQSILECDNSICFFLELKHLENNNLRSCIVTGIDHIGIRESINQFDANGHEKKPSIQLENGFKANVCSTKIEKKYIIKVIGEPETIRVTYYKRLN